MRRKWGTALQRRWIKIADELPSTMRVTCGYYEDGWSQICGQAMSWRFVSVKRQGEPRSLRIKRIEFICPACGSHFVDDELSHADYHEWVKDLIFEQYEQGFLVFAHHDAKKVGHP